MFQPNRSVIKLVSACLLLAGSAGRCALSQNAPSISNLRLMPLGDSITAGYLSSTGNGYRGPLSTLLAGQVATLDLVGSQIGGTMLDPDHEGHSHYEIAQIAALTTQQVSMYKPNVVTLLAGVNDLGNSDDVANAPNRLAALYSSRGKAYRFA